MKTTVENVRKYEKGALRGFFDLVMEDFMRINGCQVFCKGESWWINLPQKPYKDANGVDKWQSIIEMPAERLSKLRDLVMPMLQSELGEEKPVKPVPTKTFEGMEYGTAQDTGKKKVEGGDWEIPAEAGDISGIGDNHGLDPPSDDIPF